MATGTMQFNIEALGLADGTASNAAPALNFVTTSDVSNPKHRHWSMDFDDTTDEFLFFSFRMPTDYASGGTFKLPFYMQSATTGNIKWGIAVQAVTPGDSQVMTALDPVNDGGGWSSDIEAVPGTAKHPDEASISPGMDSAAAGDTIHVSLRREPSDTGNDTATGDGSLNSIIVFEYTTT